MTRASSRGPRRRAEAAGEARAGSYLIRAGFSARSRRAHPQNSRMRRSADASERLICNDHPSSCALAPQLRCARGSSCAGLPGRGCQLCSFIGLRCCYWRLPPGSGVVLAICGYAGQLIDFTWHAGLMGVGQSLASLCAGRETARSRIELGSSRSPTVSGLFALRDRARLQPHRLHTGG